MWPIPNRSLRVLKAWCFYGYRLLHAALGHSCSTPSAFNSALLTIQLNSYYQQNHTENSSILLGTNTMTHVQKGYLTYSERKNLFGTASRSCFKCRPRCRCVSQNREGCSHNAFNIVAFLQI